MIDIPLDAPAVRFDERLIVFLPPDWRGDTGAAVRPARFLTAEFDEAVGRVVAGEGIAAVTFDPPDVERCRARLTPVGGVLDEGTPWIAGGPLTVAALRNRNWARSEPKEPPPRFRPARFGFATSSGASLDAGMLARARGCLLGQFAGDALGGLVEFGDEEGIRRRYPDGVRDLADGGVWHNLAGQPTDDSELALMLARSIVHAGGYAEKVAVSAYADWFNDPQTFDKGMTISRALRAVLPDATHEQRLAAIEQHAGFASEANGSLMRISPLGIFTRGSPAAAAMIARRDSGFTHPNPVCRDACAVLVVAISELIARGDRQRAYEAALAVPGVDPKVRAALTGAKFGPPDDFETNMGHVIIALRNAFAQLLHAPSLEEGVVDTVGRGGDTDTNGAIAGALLGAACGEDAIPARWRQCVLCCRPAEGAPTAHPRAREFWPVDARELAAALLEAGRDRP